MKVRTMCKDCGKPITANVKAYVYLCNDCAEKAAKEISKLLSK